MEEQYEAVRLILDRLYKEGLEWYRAADAEEADLFANRITGTFSKFEGAEIHVIGRKPKGSFPGRSILLMQPAPKEKDALLALWLRWDFEATPMEYRVFVGQWSVIEGERSFIAFRFEAPEQGDEHDYFHCQPCRNFGDKLIVPGAALVSDRFPTIPLNASNIVEVTMCAIMAALGRRKMRKFVQGLLKDPSAYANAHLRTAYARCCKQSSVAYPFDANPVAAAA